MTTPRVPSVTSRFRSSPEAGGLPRSGVTVLVVSSYKDAPADADTQTLDGPFTTLADAEATVGDDGLVHDALSGLWTNAAATVYTVGVLAAEGDTVAPASAFIAALAKADQVPVPLDFIICPGGGSGAGRDQVAADDLIGGSGGLALRCEQLDCLSMVAIPSAASLTDAQRLAWVNANTRSQTRVMAVGPEAAASGNAPPEGDILGAAIAIGVERGRQTGLNYAPVAGVTGIGQPYSYSLRGASSAATALINAGATLMVRQLGRIVLLGGQFGGATDSRRFWGTMRAFIHLDHVLDGVARGYIGRGLRGGRLQAIANHMERSARSQLVLSGELAEVSVRPDEAANDPATLAGGTAYFSISVLPVGEIVAIVLTHSIQVASTA